jgi:DEAD/DEAH box helicase domain-containing protein
MLSLAQCIAQLLAAPPAGSQIRSTLTLPYAQAPSTEFPAEFPQWFRVILQTQGITRLATYQWQALQHWQQGQHVCVSAPAGGGRGIVRLLALYHSLAAAQRGHALLLFPHKERELTQLATITAWNAQAPAEHRLTAAIYDGDTAPTERRFIRQSPPQLLLTTPEMLHAGILAYHAGWRAFFQGLRAVVLADVHCCSGALGAHVTHLIQRLQRLSHHYGAQPQYLLTSAPAANLQDVARTLTGQPCTLVTGTAVDRYQHSRLVLEVHGPTELVVQELVARLNAADAPPFIIQRAQHARQSAGRIPPSARCVLFVGVPGALTLMHEDLSLLTTTQAHSLGVLLLRSETALEHYLLRYPAVYETLWLQDLGLYPKNALVTQRHLQCAAAELAPAAPATAVRLPGTPEMPPHQPHRGIQLRTYEPSFALVLQGNSALLTTVSPARAFRHCFEGAVYRHGGQTFHVERRLPERRRILVRPIEAPYLTRGMVHTSITEQQIEAAVAKDSFRIANGMLTYTETLHAYERLDGHTGVRLSIHALSEQRRTIHTQGVWIDMPAVTADHNLADTALHTLVHAVLSSLPLFLADTAMCIRGDVQQAQNGGTGLQAVFVDAHAGGNGASAFVYRTHEHILRASLQILLNCNCLYGCSRCVALHPDCDACLHNGALDRQAGVALLQQMLQEMVPVLEHVRLPGMPPVEHPIPQDRLAPRHIYLRLTTQHSAEDVGGWQHKHLLGLGVAVTYDTRDRQYRVYTAETAADLLSSLSTADLVIGFSLRDFDYQVLQPYTTTPLTTLPSLALLDEVQHQLGFRLSLNHLTRETLGVERPDDSLRTLDWFRQGDRNRIAEYCRHDLKLLRALVHHGATTGSIFYRDLSGERHAMPVQWPDTGALENP